MLGKVRLKNSTPKQKKKNQ